MGRSGSAAAEWALDGGAAAGVICAAAAAGLSAGVVGVPAVAGVAAPRSTLIGGALGWGGTCRGYRCGVGVSDGVVGPEAPAGVVG